jgi:hypothetical protein
MIFPTFCRVKVLNYILLSAGAYMIYCIFGRVTMNIKEIKTLTLKLQTTNNRKKLFTPIEKKNMQKG